MKFFHNADSEIKELVSVKISSILGNDSKHNFRDTLQVEMMNEIINDLIVLLQVLQEIRFFF